MRHPLALATVAGMLLAAPAAADAATTITVTSTADAGPGTLRQALSTASTGDTIVLPAGTIELSSGYLPVTTGVTIRGQGARATVIDGNHAVRVLSLSASAPVTITDLTVTGGRAPGGAGIDSAAPLTLRRVAVVGNESTTSGGGIDQRASFTFDRVLIANNVSVAQGAGLDAESSGASSLTNAVIVGNVTTGGGSGAAINTSLSTPAVNLTVTNATIVANRAIRDTQGPGIRIGTGGTLSLRNTVLAGNNEPAGVENCFAAGGATITSLGHNLTELEGAADGCNLLAPTDRHAAPMLSELADHGGPFNTLVPLPGSPLLDAGDPAACPALDVRGVPRPKGAGCDIGAVELAPPSAVTGAVLDVTSTSARLTGTVDGAGLAASARFVFGPTAAYGTATAAQAIAPDAPTPVETTLTGLTPGTTYHVRLEATGTDGAANGADVAFTTPAVEPIRTSDTVAPNAMLALATKKLAQVRKRKRLEVVCALSERATCALTLSVDRRTAGRLGLSVGKGKKRVTLGTGTATGAGKVTVRIKLSVKQLRALRALRALRVAARAKLSDTAGNTRTVTGHLLVR